MDPIRLQQLIQYIEQMQQMQQMQQAAQAYNQMQDMQGALSTNQMAGQIGQLNNQMNAGPGIYGGAWNLPRPMTGAPYQAPEGGSFQPNRPGELQSGYRPPQTRPTTPSTPFPPIMGNNPVGSRPMRPSGQMQPYSAGGGFGGPRAMAIRRRLQSRGGSMPGGTASNSVSRPSY